MHIYFLGIMKRNSWKRHEPSHYLKGREQYVTRHSLVLRRTNDCDYSLEVLACLLLEGFKSSLNLIELKLDEW